MFVAAQSNGERDSIVWTQNRGESFSSCDFDNTPRQGVSMFSDPRGLKYGALLVTASEDENGGHFFDLWHFDFSSLVTRDCVYPDDYENYTLVNGACCVINRR